MHLISILNSISAVLLLIYVLLIPLLIWRKTRATVGRLILASSYVIGLTLWLEGLVTSYYYLGVGWLVVGLFFAGVGVVPIGVVGSVLHHDWHTFWILVVNIATLIVVRVIASAATSSDK